MIALIVICASCQRSLTPESFSDFEKNAFAAYCTNDIQAAEGSLLNGLQTISEYESQHVAGIDFDSARGLFHERLFLIYLQTHETNKMMLEFQKSMECMARSKRRWGESPPPVMSYEEFAKKLNSRERNVNVGWKTNGNDLK